MRRSITRGALCAATAAAALVVLAPQASAAANVNFVGTWKTSNGQPFTIKKENRATGACSGTTSLSKGGYRLVACHVTGDHYAFTITLGATYKSYNKGKITGNRLVGAFHDTNGATGTYSAVR